MMHSDSRFQDIVLVGGGHTHSLFLRQLGDLPIPNARVTLVSLDCYSPYSGMLPGLIAGHYQFSDNHIDLIRLCQFANVTFVKAKVIGISPDEQRIHLEGRPDLEYDIVSINIGAAPMNRVKDADKYAVGIKPIDQFYTRWQAVRQAMREAPESPSVVVVGGGAGGIETLLAMEYACDHDPRIENRPVFHLVCRGERILNSYPKALRQAVLKKLRARGIDVHTGFDVAHITDGVLTAASGQTLQADHVFWCTSVTAPPWPQKSGLETDEEGFIAVNGFLQSKSHESVFASGDIAHMAATPRPKAGVYAVRQAPVLYDNIRRQVLGEPMKPYRPQDDFLSLLALGGQTGTGTRKSVSFHGPWVWRWKDRIDRDFMRQFHLLPAVSRRAHTLPSFFAFSSMGAFHGVMSSVPLAEDDFLAGRLMAQDWVNRLQLHDWRVEQARLQLTLPEYATQQRRRAQQLQDGIESVLRPWGVQRIAVQVQSGLYTNVTVAFDQAEVASTNRSPLVLQPGDQLISVQHVGMTTLLEAHRQNKATGRDVDTVYDTLSRDMGPLLTYLHQTDGVRVFDAYGHSLYDITQQHLPVEEGVSVQMMLTQLPALLGVQRCIEQGVVPELPAVAVSTDAPNGDLHPLYPLLFEPQLSCAPLCVVPQAQVADVSSALRERGATAVSIAQVRLEVVESAHEHRA